jgi:argininosuccinate lyase
MPMKKQIKKWSGRFNEPVDQLVQDYTASVNFDKRLAAYDIEGSLAHSEMLQKQKIISVSDFNKIKKGLLQINELIKENKFEWKIADEDVHLNIEKKLTELIGDAGKKLHTGRSRNDQIATDLRLYLRDATDSIVKKIITLQKNLLSFAKKNIGVSMPGLTHLQIAQPISFAHHLHAYFEMLERDKKRFIDARKRINQLPLGAAALAGTTYPIDRKWVAKKLKFEGVCNNSLDAVSDRDFAIEFCFHASLLMTHLSRFSEELIMWMSPFFNFIEISDRFCTGSSIMPQKKNPDVPELVRGKVGRTNGNLMALLTLMKSQPLAYNKDNQEDKEPVFDSVDTLEATLVIYADMIKNIKVNKEKMMAAAGDGFSTATDLADYLVKKGMPFRTSHEVVAELVNFAIKNKLDLHEITLDTFKHYSKLIDKDIYDVITVEGSVQARNHVGGTNTQNVANAIKLAEQSLSKKGS